ncbi:sugar transferase [uncultured Imperialibacter sp.]|uniref:sugar transferase n=1 Tax=uncultured Imperialibacter sp. TaxID=1672639 RepID=UPI0030D965BE|tara:strand:+ start:31059 stop:31664 length:606 start_codon:yes stop_codon:yes gene_type:complete
MYRRIFKRVFDVLFSALLLLIASPLIVIIAVILFFQNKRRIFFFQERPGLNERAFEIIKFKTMNDKVDELGVLLPDNQRITKAGRVIRKLSLDELPQLINVIKGDMSLIGPRPLLFKYIPLYNEDQRRRHQVRPGITGWAQVNGRNSISWHKRFELDIHYLENLSFYLDMEILFMTFAKVVKREGVNQSDCRPMEPFNGNN